MAPGKWPELIKDGIKEASQIAMVYEVHMNFFRFPFPTRSF